MMAGTSCANPLAELRWSRSVARGRVLQNEPDLYAAHVADFHGSRLSPKRNAPKMPPAPRCFTMAAHVEARRVGDGQQGTPGVIRSPTVAHDTWHLTCTQCARRHQASSAVTVTKNATTGNHPVMCRRRTCVMRSEPQESSREVRSIHHSAEGPAQHEAAEVFQPAMSPVNISNRVSQPWIQAAEAVVDWYGAMFRLAFGLGRPGNGHDPQDVVTSAPPPPLAEEEASRAAAVQPMPNAALKLRPKRKKAPSAASRRSRASKVSSVRRTRRAA